MSKTPGRPNLSLAGKREAPKQQNAGSSSGASKRGRGGQRGGRGRGGKFENNRDGTAPKRPGLIQTGGVFSEGLGGDFPSRKKEKDADQQLFTVRKSGTKEKSDREPTTKEKKEEGESKGKTSFAGWDELWQTDDEGDEAEIKCLNPKGFITDYKRGTILPEVLPLEDQPQFIQVLHKKSQALLADEADEDKKHAKCVITGKERKSPQDLIAMIEASTSEFLHLQLPSVIGSICRDMEKNEQEPMEMDESNDQTTTDTSKNDANSGLPRSRRIGKIQVTKKGKLLIHVGGHSINMTSKAVVGKQQGTVLLETEPLTDPMQSPPGFSGYNNPQNATNSIYYIGNVKHNLVGSMTWSELNENREKKMENIEMEGERNEVEIGEDVKKELKSLDDIQKGWQGMAEKWAAGLLGS